MFLQLVLMAAIMSLLTEVCTAHGRLWDPPGRSTMWRVGFSTPVNYNDMSLFCGGFSVHWNQNGGLCGICGDDYADAQPRAHEAGGFYGKGVISQTYTQGQDITVLIELTTTHMGWMEIRICPNNNVTQIATQQCLDQYVLERADNQGTKILVDNDIYFYSYDFKLPPGLTCSQCVVQWKYHTGNSWGCLSNGTCCTGCGPVQEEFYACSDVEILGTGTTTPPPDTSTTPESTTPPPTTNPETTTLTSSTTPASTTTAGPGQCGPSAVYENVYGMLAWCLDNCFPPPGVAVNCPASHCTDACRNG